MSMPLSIEWKLLTHGEEVRLQKGKNFFQITLEGYRLFPIGEPIEIKRHHDSDQIGNGEITELTWKEETTICKYQLISLFNVN